MTYKEMSTKEMILTVRKIIDGEITTKAIEENDWILEDLQNGLWAEELNQLFEDYIDNEDQPWTLDDLGKMTIGFVSARKWAEDALEFAGYGKDDEKVRTVRDL